MTWGWALQECLFGRPPPDFCRIWCKTRHTVIGRSIFLYCDIGFRVQCLIHSATCTHSLQTCLALECSHSWSSSPYGIKNMLDSWLIDSANMTIDSTLIDRWYRQIGGNMHKLKACVRHNCRRSWTLSWPEQEITMCRNMRNALTLKVLVMTIDAQWEGMGDVGSARYKPATSPMPDHKGFKLQ